MKIETRIITTKKGFAILEVILAVGIAGIMITAISVAMKNISRLSFESKREAVISRIIYNELMVAGTKPNIQEGQLPAKRIDEWEIDIITEITALEDLTNQDGAILNNLFKIEVNASFWENGEYVTRTAETWRNSDIYAR